MFDNVPQARIYKSWNVPPRDTEAAAHFDLASRSSLVEKFSSTKN